MPLSESQYHQSKCGPFAPRTFRPPDLSPPGSFAPRGRFYKRLVKYKLHVQLEQVVNLILCLNKLRVNSPEYAAEIIKTCVVMHNLCINIKGSVDDEVLTQYVRDQLEERQQPMIDHIGENQGRRRQLIQHFN